MATLHGRTEQRFTDTPGPHLGFGGLVHLGDGIYEFTDEPIDDAVLHHIGDGVYEFTDSPTGDVAKFVVWRGAQLSFTEAV